MFKNFTPNNFIKSAAISRPWRVSLGLMFCAAFLFFILAPAGTAQAAPDQIYRSVGPGNTRTLASSTPSSINLLTVDSSGNATFGSNLLAKIGVGDAIVYDSDDSNTLTVADSIIFISGRVSSSTYIVQTSTGTTSTTAFSNNDTWSIYRSYTSLSNAVNLVKNTGIIVSFDALASAKNISDNTATGTNKVWNIACYGDAIDTANVTITGWTTATSTYMRIYTPHLSSEVGVSQRHNGMWDDGKYSLETTSTYTKALYIKSAYIRIEGLQVGVMTPLANGIYLEYNNLPLGIYIYGNIIKAGSASYATTDGILLYRGSAYIYNNIIYNFTRGIEGPTGSGPVYNNTILKSATGLFGNVIKQNNLYFGNITNGGSNPIDLSGYATSSIFVDYANNDFRLVAGSPVIGAGTNLTNDPSLSFSTDIQNESRPSSGAWDFGADEYHFVASGDVTPPIISVVASSTTGLGTNIQITWTTNEISTSTVMFGPTIGYGSASSSNTFVTSHSIVLRNLSAGSTYHFQVSSADPSGNMATSSDYSFVATQILDITAPTVPASLSATAFSPTQINLTWASSTDVVGVTGYRIYRGGARIATTSSISYSDTSLSATTNYSYAVSAHDAAGNVSASSTSASATTTWSVISDLPQIISQPILKAYPGIEYNIRLGVIGGKAKYTFGLDTAPSGMAISSNGTVTWTPGAGLNGQSFPVTYRVTDALGQSVTQSFSLSATTTGFYFVSTSGNDTTGTGAIGAPWATINKGLSSGSTGDTVYVRAGTYTEVWVFVSGKANRIIAYPGESPIADFNFQFSSTQDSGTYVDGFEIRNAQRWGFSVSSGVDNLVFRRNHMHGLYDNSVSGNPSFVFFWDGAGYRYDNIVFQDNIFNDLFDRGSGLHGDDSANYHGGSTIWYNVANSLYEDNEAYNIDGSGIKDKDDGLKNTFRGNYFHDNYETGIGLNNQYSEDGAEVEYNIFEGADMGLVVGSQPGYIRNIDIHHNTFYGNGIWYRWVLDSEDTNFITRDNIFANQSTFVYTVGTAIVGDLLGSASYFDNNIIQTTFSYVFGNGGGVTPLTLSDWQTTYQKDLHSSLANPFLRDPANGDFTPLASSSVCTAGSDGGYVGALPCAAGSDVTAPTVPASLSATAVSPTQINLTWASSTDAVGVTGYRIYRGGVRIATTTNSSYSNTGLSASTLYSYTVSAYDAAGNISASSTAATSTTLSGSDITAPTVPASLSATAISPTQINLAWASSTDAVGVTGYRIYRGGARIATTTNSSYSNTGLSASTLYSYTVSAYDAAGNISASSTVATSTTFALSTYSIGGSISGLTGTVVLQNNGKDNLSRSANGSFTFATATTTGNPYSVTILTQPTGQTCIATTSSGTVSGANVTSVSITCTTNTFTITASTGANGTVTPSGVTTKDYGSSQVYTIATSTAGYHVADILVDGSSVGTSSLTYTFTNITANHTISATFNINHYTITSSVSGANGTISPLGATIVSYGATPTYTIATSTAGYHVADILVDGVSVGTSTLPYVFPAVHANHTIVASFSINHYTITASAGANGTVTPSGVTTKNYGTSQAYTIATSTAGYHVSNILVDGSPIGTSSLTYTFTNITTNHTISATFSNGSTPATYSIGGTISGLTGTVVLQNNGGDNKTISANGSFTFATDLASAASYLITVLTNPSNQTCTVLSDSGTVSGANVTSVSVTCTTNTCSTLSNTATYNAYPTCGAATCSSGYTLSGSGASATCVAQSSGGGGGGSSTPTDTTAPGTPTNFSVHSTSSLTVLSWTNPTASDFAGVKLYRKINSAPSSQADTSATLIYQGKNTSYTDTSSKTAGISYYYSIYSFDARPNYSQPATISIVISAGAGASTTPVATADTTPPGLVTNFFASSSIDHVVLSWTKPSDADFAGVKIFHKVGSPLTSHKDVLASEIYQGNAQTFIDSGLLSGKDYYYSIYTYDNNLNYSNVVATHAITGSGINIPASTVPVVNNSGSTVTTLIGATGATVNAVVADESQKLIANAGFAPLTSPEIAIYKKTIALTSSSLTDEKKFMIADFIHYGTPTTLSLGAGERAGSVASFHSAFGRLPTSDVDWQDVIKIGNGRWTTQVNAAAEAKAKFSFKKIYLREPNNKKVSDNAAVNVMAYGLRPAARNMNSEKAATNSFKYIYKKSPTTAADWDMVRAIAYSGATR